MAISREQDFVTGVTVVTAEFLNLLQEFLAGQVPNLRLTKLSNTQVQVDAGSEEDSVGLVIDGELRRRDSNVAATVSGAAGTKNIYATGDSADNLFALEVADGAAAATHARKIGELRWSGTAITEIHPMVGPDIMNTLQKTTTAFAGSSVTLSTPGTYGAPKLSMELYVPSWWNQWWLTTYVVVTGADKEVQVKVQVTPTGDVSTQETRVRGDIGVTTGVHVDSRSRTTQGAHAVEAALRLSSGSTGTDSVEVSMTAIATRDPRAV